MPASKKTTTLREFREKHFKELDENIRVWKSIRDDEEATDKDKSEAAKNIQRSLGGLSPDKATSKPTSHAKEEVTPEEDAAIKKILGGAD